MRYVVIHDAEYERHTGASQCLRNSSEKNKSLKKERFKLMLPKPTEEFVMNDSGLTIHRGMSSFGNLSQMKNQEAVQELAQFLNLSNAQFQPRQSGPLAPGQNLRHLS